MAGKMIEIVDFIRSYGLVTETPLPNGSLFFAESKRERGMPIEFIASVDGVQYLALSDVFWDDFSTAESDQKLVHSLVRGVILGGAVKIRNEGYCRLVCGEEEYLAEPSASVVRSWAPWGVGERAPEVHTLDVQC
jgi:hypothetical protein